MKHYLDIHLRPDPEIAPAHLMNALFTRLHQALAMRGETSVGVSFPGIHATPRHLGHCLRLHGSEQSLAALNSAEWLGAVQDHVRIDPLRPVPPQVRYRVVRRVQAKSSPARLRRRQMRRHGYDEIEALRRVPEAVAERLELPFVSIRSTSTGQAFRLFVEHGPLLDEASAGSFSAYGLSTGATIPWF